MKAMVLSAGLGTRLRPLTFQKPKALIPLAGRPVIEYVIALLKHHHITDLVINLYHLPQQIERHLADGSAFGVKITYSFEEELYGTAGALLEAKKYLGDKTILVINSDILTEIDLSQAVKFHRQKKALATLVLSQNQDPSNYGVIGVDGVGRIRTFLDDKSESPAFLTKALYTGISVLEPPVFDYISSRFSGLGDEVFPKMLKANEPVYGYLAAGYWLDLGTPERLAQAEKDVQEGKVKIF